MTRADAPARVSRAVPRIVGCAEADPRLFARALGWRVVLPLAKMALPMRVLARWMNRRHRPLPPTRRPSRIAAVERLARDGGRLLVSGNCLERSLLFYRFLSEAGVDPTLVIGVRRDDAAVAGHAWIEVDGRVFAEPTMADHEPIVRFGP